MKILYLLTQDLESPYGIGRCWPLARELARSGHQVRIVTLHPDFDALSTRQQNLDGVEVHYVAPMHVKKSGNQKSYYRPYQLIWVSLRATLALSWAALRSPANIVYVGKPHPMNSIAGLLNKTLRGLPMVVDCDDFEAGSGRFGGKWQKSIIEFFEKRIPRLAVKVTTNTYFMRDNLISWGVTEDKIAYLPNGVDPKRFSPPDVGSVDAERSRLGIVGKKVIAYIGSLSLPSHPVNLLLDAFAKILITIPDTVLMIVGGGENLEDLQKQALELGIEDQIRFIGRVSPEEIPLYYALADVSVDPVHDDPAARGRLPLKLFESWISGVPFVTADVGDRAFVMGDPPAGVLVSPGQTETLAEGIATILSNADLSATVIEKGKEKVKDYYWEPLAEMLENQAFSVGE
jgi:glycosyltransferase involved in cell wall biosynthesis